MKHEREIVEVERLRCCVNYYVDKTLTSQDHYCVTPFPRSFIMGEICVEWFHSPHRVAWLPAPPPFIAHVTGRVISVYGIGMVH